MAAHGAGYIAHLYRLTHLPYALTPPFRRAHSKPLNAFLTLLFSHPPPRAQYKYPGARSEKLEDGTEVGVAGEVIELNRVSSSTQVRACTLSCAGPLCGFAQPVSGAHVIDVHRETACSLCLVRRSSRLRARSHMLTSLAYDQSSFPNICAFCACFHSLMRSRSRRHIHIYILFLLLLFTRRSPSSRSSGLKKRKVFASPLQLIRRFV